MEKIGNARRNISLGILAGERTVRAAFAWQHDVGLTAYDRIVGVHQLGELFPGLNSIKDKKRDKLDLNPAHPGVVGLVRTPEGFAAPTGRFRVLFGLNRLGPVELHIRLVEAGTIAPAVQLNGNTLELLLHATAKNVYIAILPAYRRGTNRIDVHLAPGLAIQSLELVARSGPASGREL